MAATAEAQKRPDENKAICSLPRQGCAAPNQEDAMQSGASG